MAIPLTINGAVFEYPENLDQNWGINATGWAQAVTNGMLQMAGGSFPLTADVNFGANFGILSKYFETRSAFPATTGTVRLSPADAGIAWRDNAHSSNLVLTTNSSDQLLFNGHPIASSGGGAVTSIIATANQTTVSGATGDVTIGTVQDINSTSSPTFAALTLSTPLSIGNGGTGQSSFSSGAISSNGSVLTSGTLPVADGGTGDASLTAYAVLTGGTTSTAPIQSVAGIGSAGQVLTSNGPSALPTFQNATGTGTVNSGTASHIAYYATSSATISDSGIVNTNLFLADGSVTATGALNLGSHKITGVTQGTTSGDAISFPVATGQVSSNTLTGSTANSGGSAGNLAQGTISTPDLRANAVTQFIEKSADSGGHSVAGFTTIDSITITSLGGAILFDGHAGIEFTLSGGAGGITLAIWKNGSGTALPGAYMTFDTAGLSGTTDYALSVGGSDIPVAGTNTYNFGYVVNAGSAASVENYNFRALELRA